MKIPADASCSCIVLFIPFDKAGRPGQEVDLISDFVTNPSGRAVRGRPTDVIPNAKGGLLISDDHAGAGYQLYPSRK